MSMSTMAVLEGGPEDLPERVVPITPPGVVLRLRHHNGYEHFKVTPRHQDTPTGRLAVYEWVSRTELAE